MIIPSRGGFKESFPPFPLRKDNTDNTKTGLSPLFLSSPFPPPHKLQQTGEHTPAPPALQNRASGLFSFLFSPFFPPLLLACVRLIRGITGSFCPLGSLLKPLLSPPPPPLFPASVMSKPYNWKNFPGMFPPPFFPFPLGFSLCRGPICSRKGRFFPPSKTWSGDSSPLFSPRVCEKTDGRKLRLFPFSRTGKKGFPLFFPFPRLLIHAWERLEPAPSINPARNCPSPFFLFSFSPRNFIVLAGWELVRSPPRNSSVFFLFLSGRRRNIDY